MVKAIAFDFGGTLFSTAGMGNFTLALQEIFVAKVGVNFGLSRSDSNSIFEKYVAAWRARRMRAQELPDREISSYDLLETALSSSGVFLDRSMMIDTLNAFHSIESEGFTPFANVIESLTALAALGYRLAIVSNNPWAESIMAVLRRYKVELLFEQVIVSCDVGYRKPHERIFEELMTRLDLPGSEILFVGDSFAHDVVMPKRLGLKTCLVDFEGNDRNSQRASATNADIFLTQIDRLAAAVAELG